LKKSYSQKHAEIRITNCTQGLETPTSFGVQAPFSGSLEYKGLQHQHISLERFEPSCAVHVIDCTNYARNE